jgi:multidrug efflux pump subunit AcrA (membrane-fusion protein)
MEGKGGTLKDDTSLLPVLQPEATAPAAATKPDGKRSWRARLLWSVAGLAALGAGWVFAGSNLRPKEKESLPPETEMTEREAGTVVVSVAPVVHRAVQRRVEAVGTLYGYEEVSIAAKMEGRVLKIFHDVADKVKPGDLLVEFDPTDYDLLLHQAEKSLRVDLAKLGVEELPKDFDLERLPAVVQARERMNNTKLRLDRVRTLARSSAATPEDLTDRTVDYRSAEAEFRNQILLARSLVATVEMKREGLRIARQHLKDMALVVPEPLQKIPGMERGAWYVVSQRDVAEGSFVKTGTEVLKLVIDGTLKLKVLIPERFSNEIQLGQEVQVFTAAYSQPFPGRVARINPTVDPTNRTLQVEIGVPNPEGKLKPGSFAKASILTRHEDNVATVPLDSLTTFAGITKIFLMEDGRVKEVRVSLGTQNTEWVEIVQPSLPRGAQVVLSGQTALADGTPVVVRRSLPSSPSAR